MNQEIQEVSAWEQLLLLLGSSVFESHEPPCEVLQ